MLKAVHKRRREIGRRVASHLQRLGQHNPQVPAIRRAVGSSPDGERMPRQGFLPPVTDGTVIHGTNGDILAIGSGDDDHIAIKLSFAQSR